MKSASDHRWWCMKLGGFDFDMLAEGARGGRQAKDAEGRKLKGGKLRTLRAARASASARRGRFPRSLPSRPRGAIENVPFDVDEA